LKVIGAANDSLNTGRPKKRGIRSHAQLVGTPALAACHAEQGCITGRFQSAPDDRCPGQPGRTSVYNPL